MTAVTVGTPVPALELVVDAGRMRTMAALLDDPNPIHWDVDAVRALGLGDRPVNQGPSNAGYVVNALVAFAGGDPGAVRRVSVRFRGNVLAGDRVTAGGVVTAVTTLGSDVVATCEVWLDRDDGARLVSGTAEVRLPG